MGRIGLFIAALALVVAILSMPMVDRMIQRDGNHPMAAPAPQPLKRTTPAVPPPALPDPPKPVPSVRANGDVIKPKGIGGAANGSIQADGSVAFTLTDSGAWVDAQVGDNMIVRSAGGQETCTLVRVDKMGGFKVPSWLRPIEDDEPPFWVRLLASCPDREVAAHLAVWVTPVAR